MDDQGDLFDPARMPEVIETARFDGAVYDPKHDDDRLKKQLGRVWAALTKAQERDEWLTLSELETATGDPQASISAQLRHLRKARFGAYTILKQHRGERAAGLWEYQLQPKE